MRNKVIVTVLVLAGIVGLGFIAHTINLVGILKRLHGG